MIIIKKNLTKITAIHLTPPQKRETSERKRRVSVFSQGSIIRAKSKIREYVSNGNFNAFCTFTFSPRDFDRKDFKACKKFLTDYLTHKLHWKKWLVIPELHADGSIHFHGFCSIKKKSLKYGYAKRDSHGKIHFHYYSERINNDIGRNDFQFFSPASKDDVRSMAAYVLKYITKATMTDFALLYFNSRGLKTDEIVFRLTSEKEVQGFFAFAEEHKLREYSTAHFNFFELTPELLAEYQAFKWYYDVIFTSFYQNNDLQPLQLSIF